MRVTLNKYRALPDFATKYHWDLRIPEIPGAGATAEELSLRCISAALPKKTNTPMEVILRGGHKVYQPGISTFGGTIQLTFVETIDSVISSMFSNWANLIWESDTGAQSYREVVKTDILLIRLTPVGTAWWMYRLRGVFLTDWDPGELSTDGGTPSQPNGTFQYDDFVEAQSL